MEEILTTDVLRDGTQCYTRFLTKDDIGMSMFLQNDIAKALEEEENSNFIVPKTKEQFERNIDDKGRMIGIFVEKEDGAERLIAQSVLSLPKDGMENNLCDFKPPYKNSEIALLESGAVHPEFRGNGLQAKMVDMRAKIAKKIGRKQLYSEIAKNNIYSWSVLLKYNMVLVSAGVDASDGCELYYAHKDLTKDDMKKNQYKKVLMANPFEFPFENQKKLFNDYVIYDWDNKNSMVTFGENPQAEQVKLNSKIIHKQMVSSL